MNNGTTESLDVFKVGSKYRVVMSDCCVNGSFTATVTEARGFEYDANGNAPDEADSVTFDNGVTLTDCVWSNLEVEEII